MFKRKYARLLLGIIMILLAFILSACHPSLPSPPEPELAERLPMLADVEATTATVYYATLDKNYLLPLNVNIKATKEVARVAMEKLLAGPPTTGAAPLLPQDTKLLDLYSSKSTVYVNVTNDIYGLEWKDAPLAVDSILNTILPLAEGYTLQILVEGQMINRLGDVDVSAPLALTYVNPDPAAAELLQRLEEDEEEFNGEALTYYLADDRAMFLVPQTLLYLLPEQAENEESSKPEQEAHDDVESLPAAYARAVLSAMLAPPREGENLTRPFWPGTEILDLWVENSVAYVDFSAELTGYGGGASTESMMLECLAQTLTALPGVSSVQVLIEGKPGALPEGFDISRPLTPAAPVNPI